MTIDLSQPLQWKSATDEGLLLLQNLQGNILKGHGREVATLLFFRFDTSALPEARRLLRELANYHLTSAHRQLIDTEVFKAHGVSGGDFVHLALSFAGYDALEETDAAPDDAEFVGGMKRDDSVEALSDPDVDDWEAPFQEDIHGILLAARDSDHETAALTEHLRGLLEEAGCEIVHVQHGHALRNAVGVGIEHFGYVDGRSQPLMLVEDIAAETATAGSSRWNPAFALSTALVKDPGVDDATSFGSYFVFRKLEQRVNDFKTREQEIADALDLEGEDRELAGALLVGRFEDGTPVTLSDQPRAEAPPNNFNYTDDPGRRCPFHAHIRKTNPRGTGGAEAPDQERLHIMVRRGIPYEDCKRTTHPAELAETESLAEFSSEVAPKLPDGGVGLLFMAYNSDIGNQFKFTQQIWANNAGFPLDPPGPHGIDPVIGQGDNDAGDQKLRGAWDDPDAAVNDDVPFAGFVVMRGGEYFFSPSLTFLMDL